MVEKGRTNREMGWPGIDRHPIETSGEGWKRPLSCDGWMNDTYKYLKIPVFQVSDVFLPVAD